MGWSRRARAEARRAPVHGRDRAMRPGLFLSAGMSVGLYGGSFNPVHPGHIHVAETALRRLGLDRVVWLVSPQNPLKSTRDMASLSERLATTARRASGPSMIVSDVEQRVGARYSIDTVRWLKARFPAVRFVWIMGADGLADFHLWRGWAALAREVPVAVVSRPGVALRSRSSPLARRFAGSRVPARAAQTLAGRSPPAWIYLDARYDFTSSTALRNSRLTDARRRDMEQNVSPCSRSLR
jgi:nicotinate-nucleotide adenylyltransferase